MTEILPSQSNGLMSFNGEHLFQPLIKFGSLKSLIYALKLCEHLKPYKSILLQDGCLSDNAAF